MARRKQADQVRARDRIGVTLQLFFEVKSATVNGSHIELEVTPSQCLHADCPSGCDCQSGMLAGHGSPLFLRVDGKSRLLFVGNLEEDEAELRRLTERVDRLRRASESSNDTADNPPPPRSE